MARNDGVLLPYSIQAPSKKSSPLEYLVFIRETTLVVSSILKQSMLYKKTQPFTVEEKKIRLA